MFLGSRSRPVRRADNLTAVSQPYRPPRPVKETAFTVNSITLDHSVVVETKETFN
jgi:hypothetical protein